MTFAPAESAWGDHSQAAAEPAHVAIQVRQGQVLSERYGVVGGDGNAWVFTDSTFAMKVRPSYQSVVVVLDAAAFLAVADDDDERFVLALTAEVTGELRPGSYVYDLYVDGRPILAGPFTVIPGASR